MDAYDGTMQFYVVDPSDPIIRAWQGVFPGLFEPMLGMPDGLVAHLRVPEELFNVQTRMLRPVPRHPAADVLQQHRPLDGPGRRRPTSRASRPRPTTS